jgi:hypothetical protein
MSVNAGPNSRDGRPVNTGDAATIVGTLGTVPANVGPTTVIPVTLAGSGLVVNVQAQDIAASTQTL